MKVLPPRLLAVLLLSGELVCVAAWALTGGLMALVIGLVAGVGVLLLALLSGTLGRLEHSRRREEWR